MRGLTRLQFFTPQGGHVTPDAEMGGRHSSVRDFRPLPSSARRLHRRCVRKRSLPVCRARWPRSWTSVTVRRYFGGAEAHEAESGLCQQQTREPAPAISWMNADLGQVAALPADTRAEDQCRQLAAATLHDHMPEDCEEKLPATRVVHDVDFKKRMEPWMERY